MKLIKLENKAIHICCLCNASVPAKGSSCFEDKEKDKVICYDCAQSICRTFLLATLGLDL